MQTVSMDMVFGELGGGGVVARHYARARERPSLKPGRSREAGAQWMVIFSIGKRRGSSVSGIGKR